MSSAVNLDKPTTNPPSQQFSPPKPKPIAQKTTAVFLRFQDLLINANYIRTISINRDDTTEEYKVEITTKKFKSELYGRNIFHLPFINYDEAKATLDKVSDLISAHEI